jgi:serine/threonine protein kinase/Tfp pilus assembly protein PilF
MKTATTLCGTCGAKIPDDATGQICPACLLEAGIGLLDEEPVAGVVDPGRDNGLSTPVIKKARRASGILADFGDYELLEEIGRGGQGVVYRAHQKSLNRTVALKVIGLGPWTTEAHLKRFRREAEAAASLDHPGIVPIYEVGEREGCCYFSMKFVEGGQLDKVVKHAPLPTRQAVELIAKIARTVYYAHEHGILHRDIKPGNILLDAEGEPLLTDFGLARLVESESTITRTWDVMGTPSYMAPEQAKGNQGAAVSSGDVASAKAASPPTSSKLARAIDVYGLGAVLYQLVTGQPPFAGGTTYETIKLLLETEPRQPRLLNPKIDRDLNIICLKCLEKDPMRRYPSALALAEDLEHWLKQEPIRAHRTGIFARGRKWVRRNPTSALLAASLIALAAAAGWIVWKSESEFVPRPVPNGVAVLPFENLSLDPENAYFAEGIHEEILTRLASIAGLKVISRTSTQQYQNKPKNLREIAKQLGAANIVEGSVQKAADQVRVNVQLINAQTDSHLWADTYDRKLTDIFGVESEIAKRIAESLQAKLTVREQQALAAKPTNNPEAYDAYLRGLASEARFAGQYDLRKEAIGFYERAVQLDPNFAIAWARLSRAQAFIFLNFVEPTAARRDAAKSALENAQKLAPNSPETLLALGYYQYWVLRDYAFAKITFGRVSQMLPGNSDVLTALGRVARRDGHWDQSIGYFEAALLLDPRNVQLLSEAALTYAIRREFPVALKLYDRVLNITPNDETMALKASIYQAQGNLPEAARFLAQTNERTPDEDTFEIKITQLRLERNYGEAIRLLQARLAHFPFDSDYYKANEQVDLAFMERLAGDTAAARITAKQACYTLEELYRDEPDRATFAAHLSEAYALMGQKDLALKIAERPIMLYPRTRDAMRGPAFEENLALIQTIVGDNSRAISALAQLLQTPYESWLYDLCITQPLLSLDPLWDPLRGDRAFQKICEEKRP